MNRTRLLVIESHEAVRQALVARLATSDEVEVVANTGDPEEGLRQALLLRPDVIVVELKGSNGGGLGLMRRLAEAGLISRVIVLTSYPDDEERLFVLRAGARHYLLKDLDSQHLIETIQAVSREAQL